MSNLKEKISNIYLTLKKSLEKFPLTIITIIMLTLICVINLDQDFIKESTIMNIAFFAVTFANSTFLIETIVKNKTKRNILYIIPAIISGIFTYIYVKPEIFEQILDWIRNLYICYMISIFVISVYYNYKRSEKTFAEYVTSVFVNTLKASVVYGILSIGVAIVSSIFVYLILDGKSYSLILRVELLILGIYYVPTMIYALYNVDEQISKFSKIVIKYVLGILVIVAFAIIYMYIIKIIVLRDMPSNQIFRILAVLFVLGCPIWTMIEMFKEETIIDKINKWLPILFVPFIILQIYSIGVRISNNGITESRYLCIMLVIFETIYTIVYLTKREEIGKMLLLVSILTIISTITPYVNMYNISRVSQVNNLKLFKEKTEYTEEEKEKIIGAYDYLIETDEGKKHINNLLTLEEEEYIKNLRKEQNEVKYSNIVYISASSDVNYLDISEYRSLYRVYESEYTITEEKADEVFSNLKIELEESQSIKVDISDKINEYIKYDSTALRNNFEKINKIKLDDNRVLILTSISISYNKEQKTVQSYNLSGYLLEK